MDYQQANKLHDAEIAVYNAACDAFGKGNMTTKAFVKIADTYKAQQAIYDAAYAEAYEGFADDSADAYFNEELGDIAEDAKTNV